MATFISFAILGVSSLVTSFISGILGMAGGMILMGILLAMLPLPEAMMLHGITQLASNGWRALLWRDKVDWRIFRGYVYGAATTLAIFAVAKLVVSKPVAFIVMGMTPFVAMLLPEKWHLNVERKGQPYTCGAICSSLALLAGVSGPILDVFFVRSKMGRHAVVATKAMTQSFSHISKIIYFGIFAAIGGSAEVNPWMGGLMVILAFAGTSLSRHVLERMNDKSFRLWTRWTVLTLGVFYLGSGIWSLVRG
jgi:uncharacterized membrane protein YfcA